MDRLDLRIGTVARYNERRRDEARKLWREFHRAQAERHRRTLEELINHHEQQAALMFCEEDLPASRAGAKKGGT